MGGQGYFEQTFSSLDETKANLVNLLLTNKGERYMLPEFGTDIFRLLFENIEIDIENQIENDIRGQVSFWLPEVLIKDIKVDISTENVELNRINIFLTFSLQSDLNRFDSVNLEFIV